MGQSPNPKGDQTMTDRLYVDAAAELRRLRASNADLLAALQRLLDLDSGTATDTNQDWDAAVAAAHNAIAKAEGRAFMAGFDE